MRSVTKPPLRIAFFGLPLAALLLAADGHAITYAAISRRDGLGLGRLRRRLGSDVVRVLPDLDDPDEVRAIAETAPDLVVSWFWTRLLPRSVRTLGARGAFGVHPSLLPRHRGPDPTSWAILLGDEVTGVSAHVLDDAYDTGAVFAQRTLRIDDRWNAFDLAKALDRPSLALLRELAAAFATGPAPVAEAQDATHATSAPALPDAFAEIAFARPTVEVLRQIRALSPAPGAFAAVGDSDIVILRARPAKAPRALELPGEVAVWNGEVLIKTLDAAVIVEEATLDEQQLDLEDWQRLLA